MGNLKWLGIVLSGLVSVLLMLFLWAPLMAPLRQFIRGGPTWSIEEFMNIGIAGAVISLFLSLLWYVLGRFVFKEPANGLWVVFFVIVVLVAVVPCIYPLDAIFKFIILGKTQNPWFLGLIYFVNNVVIGYWLPTLLFSPPTQQFVPWGAMRVYSRGRL